MNVANPNSTGPSSDIGPAEPLLEFDALDRRFAEFISQFDPRDRHIELAARLVSHARSLGHICLDLDALTSGALDPALLALAGPMVPEASAWIEKLSASPAIGRPGAFKPLILDEAKRLYLHRYWQYETNLAADLKQRANTLTPFNPKLFGDGLVRFFPGAKREVIDGQMVAAFASLRTGLCVISGGPGTGKTRTVVVLLALMLEQRPQLRIALAAPTGKAAARLQESVKVTKASLDCAAEVKAMLPEEASTIHRLLGPIPDSAYFQHDTDHPLPFDVVVVDEASMVDLALMAKLLSALPAQARLVLLGDRNQLASVEAGSVLADICAGKEHHGFSQQFCDDFQQMTGAAMPPVPLQNSIGRRADCIVELRQNYRFGNDSGIYRLSQAVNDADASRALDVLAASRGSSDLSSRPLPAPDGLKEQLQPIVLEGFTPSLRARNPADALALLGRFRILSPLRSGPYGVENLNALVEEILLEAGLLRGRGAFPAGRAVLVTRNDYNLKLFNGDIGLIQPDLATSQMRVWFPAAGGGTRSFLPLRLPEHESAYALTVHKSQGSEFERVLLILPKEDSRVLTRELVYTGLTRASAHVELWADEPILRAAIGRRTIRRSGLREALWFS